MLNLVTLVLTLAQTIAQTEGKKQKRPPRVEASQQSKSSFVAGPGIEPGTS